MNKHELDKLEMYTQTQTWHQVLNTISVLRKLNKTVYELMDALYLLTSSEKVYLDF